MMLTTGMLISGRTSTGVVRSANGVSNRIRMAITINVEGRFSATLTIHIEARSKKAGKKNEPLGRNDDSEVSARHGAHRVDGGRTRAALQATHAPILTGKCQRPDGAKMAEMSGNGRSQPAFRTQTFSYSYSAPKPYTSKKSRQFRIHPRYKRRNQRRLLQFVPAHPVIRVFRRYGDTKWPDERAIGEIVARRKAI